MKKENLKIFGYCLATVLATTVAWGVVVLKTIPELNTDALRFVRAMYLLKENYHTDVDNHKLFEGAIKGMVEGLGDPYTVYLNEKDLQDLNEMSMGSFGGIGIIYGKHDDEYTIMSVLPETPSSAAGLKVGEMIMGVNGESTKKMNIEQVSNKIRGELGTEVILQIKSTEGVLRDVKLVRSEIKTPSVGAQMLPDSKIGYLRITVFNEHTGNDFRKKYHELEAQGMQATILDLRGNPGGLLSASVEVAGMLVPMGEIVSTVERDGTKRTEYSDLQAVKYPLAVLVDGHSASAAEIVTGAVKDRQSGKIFGTKTYGKGSVQSVHFLDAKTAVKITSAKYYTPSGVSIHKKGIEPDVVVELPKGATEDVQLKAAVEYLQNLP